MVPFGVLLGSAGVGLLVRLAVPGLGTAAAAGLVAYFVIDTIELLGLLSEQLGLEGPPWDLLGEIDINLAGRIIVGVFFVVWIGAIAYYKLARIDDKYGAGTRDTAAPRTS